MTWALVAQISVLLVVVTICAILFKES